MPVRLYVITLDCHDPRRVAEFWAVALGWDVSAPNASFGEVELHDPTGGTTPMLFMAVPESKTVKNRMHVDLVAEPSMEAEVARLVAAGASVVHTMQDPPEYPKDPHTWTVMRDPEGNEFCVAEPLPRTEP